MLYRTDLKQVKETACALLDIQIHETEYSPMIVKHPFTDNGITAIPDKDGNPQLINLMEDGNALMKWRAFVRKNINEAKSGYEIYMMVTKPYALTFLKFASHHLSREDLSQILASAWVRTEAPNQDVNVSKGELLYMFKSADPHFLMDESEYEAFLQLDDTVTVYRGVTRHNAKNVKALSWTLNQETAEWFAHRFDEDGTVYEAQIEKQHIYALFNGRNESEVILDPKYLTDISEVQDMTSDFSISM